MSGRPNRYNTAGVRCIYFAEDDATAAAEYERHTRPLRQPFAAYFADVKSSVGLRSPLSTRLSIDSVNFFKPYAYIRQKAGDFCF
jgi:hypothetical protein